MSSTQVPGTVSGFFSDVRRWERKDHRLTWRDGLLVAPGLKAAGLFHQPLAAGQQPDKLAIQGVDVPAQFCQS